MNDRSFRKAAESEDFGIDVGIETNQFVPGTIASPSTAPVRWNTTGDLRDWLGVDEGHFDWFADRKHLQQHTRAERLQHYRYTWIRKRHGRYRLIESPKQRLKEIQQTLLRDVFEQMPIHDASHGFRKGRSVRTHASPHVGKAIVLRMDLLDSFPSIAPTRLSRILMLTGYAEEVAKSSLLSAPTRHRPSPGDLFRIRQIISNAAARSNFFADRTFLSALRRLRPLPTSAPIDSIADWPD